MSKRTISALIASSAIALAGCAANPPPPPPPTNTPDPIYVCPAEEDSPGYWDAQLCGNGIGISVTNADDPVALLDTLLDTANYR